MASVDPQAQLGLFLDKFSSAVAADARQALAFLHDRLPTSSRLVYDNYNALAIAFGASDRTSDAILSIAVYPAYVSLFLLNGAALEDPDGILEGKGSKVRHIKLRPVSRIESAEVLTMIDTALSRAAKALPPSGEGALIIKSVSAKQRPRRPRA